MFDCFVKFGSVFPADKETNDTSSFLGRGTLLDK